MKVINQRIEPTKLDDNDIRILTFELSVTMRDSMLLFGNPRDNNDAKKDAKASGRKASIGTTSPISITVN